MSKYFLLAIIFILKLNSIFSQDDNLEDSTKIEGFDTEKINNIIKEANQIYDASSQESENVIVVQELDLAKELENVNSFNELRQAIAAINDSKQDRYSKDLSAYKLKYKTAIAITQKIIQEAGKLEVLYRTLEIYSDFAQNANPTNYDSFENNLERIKGGKFKSRIELPDIEISNPYISIAYSLIGGIFSKNKDRQEAIENMTCVIDYTMNFKTDLRSIDNTIKYLAASSMNLKEEGYSIFTILSTHIDYSHSYDEFAQFKINGEDDPMETARAEYFSQFADGETLDYLISRSSEIKKLEIKFLLLNSYIQSYENLLFEGLSYYTSFIRVVEKYQQNESDDYPCITDNDRSDFETMRVTLEETKETYKQAYNSVITTSDKLKLFFGG